MKYLFTGGATGGHIYPALAVADEIRRRDPEAQFLYVGLAHRLEARVVPARGYDIRFVRSRPFPRASSPLALALFGIISTAGVSMFPFLMPSSTDPSSSLTVWDATSSQMTLYIMLIATVIFLPLIIVYTSFVFRILRGKVSAEYVENNSKSLY